MQPLRLAVQANSRKIASPKSQRKAQRASQIKKGMPQTNTKETAHSGYQFPDTPFGRSQPVKAIGLKPFGGQPKVRVLDGVQMPSAAGVCHISIGTLAEPNTLHSIRMIGIVMILVNGTDGLRDVDNRDTARGSSPHKPLVPPVSADH